MNKAIERSGDSYLLSIAKYYLDVANTAFEGEVPKSKDPYANLEKKKDFNKALKYFTKARGVKISDEQKFEITNNVAYCNFELKRYNQAINEYNSIINTAEPTDEQKEFIDAKDIKNSSKYLSNALFYRGESYLKLYNWKQSRPDLIRIVREYNKTEYNPLALVSLAKSYIFEASSTTNKDAFDKAWGYYDLFFADFIKHEKAPEFLMECANTSNSYGFSDKAIKYWQKMLVSFPEHKDTGKASYLIGSTYFNMKKFEECRTQFKSFLATFTAHPNWNDAQNLLINSYYNEFNTYYAEGMKTYMKYCKFDYTTLIDVNEDTPIIPADKLLTLRTNWQNAGKSGDIFLGNYPVHNLAVFVSKMISNLAFTNAVLAEYLIRTSAIQKKQELTELDTKNIQTKYLQALEVLRNLASKYSRNDVGAEAQYHAAQILEYQIGNLADAIKEY